jgi:hypothetical protein
MVHAALLLLMLEAAQRGPRFTISLKRSTQNSSAINKLPADYPIFAPNSDRLADVPGCPKGAKTCREQVQRIALLFDHLVDKVDKRQRDSKPSAFQSAQVKKTRVPSSLR